MSRLHDNKIDFLAEFHSEVALSRAGAVLRRLTFGHEFGFSVSRLRKDALLINPAILINRFGTIDLGSTREGFSFSYVDCGIEVIIDDVGGRNRLRFIVKDGDKVVADIINKNAQGRQTWEHVT